MMTTVTTDLAEFLLARITEDETAARRASGHELFDGTGILTDDEEIPEEGWLLPLHIAEYVAAWDPARVLAECDAKRKIVGTWQNIDADDSVAPNAAFEAGRAGAQAALYTVMKLLAVPYADHPGYMDAWRPENSLT